MKFRYPSPSTSSSSWHLPLRRWREYWKFAIFKKKARLQFLSLQCEARIIIRAYSPLWELHNYYPTTHTFCEEKSDIKRAKSLQSDQHRCSIQGQRDYRMFRRALQFARHCNAIRNTKWQLQALQTRPFSQLRSECPQSLWLSGMASGRHVGKESGRDHS
ncbi:hypothetical protein BDZ91DRAFT_190423 [Kalaharituber pfeilii]|nr:hypothetical protein BDZ91DRAFT_190423 [Kalaharituber pfeilii]